MQLHTQTLRFERYTTKDGLIADEVYNMYQDKKGYLWIFSNYGTLKYNGSKFRPVLRNLPFKESFIYAIFENTKGQKWVANSNAKIFEVRNDSAFLIKGIEDVTETLKKQASEIFKLHVDDSLNMYVITKGYSYKLVKTQKGYEPINLSKSFAADSIMFAITDMGKNVIVLSNRKMIDGLKYIDKTKTTSYIKIIRGKENVVIRNPLNQLNVYNNGGVIRNLKKYGQNYYFNFSNSLGVLNTKNFFSFFKLESTVLNFTKDKYGHFWVACLNGGIYELNTKGEVLNHYLDNITVNDVLMDHNGGLWVTTPGSGLYYCENTKAKTFSKENPFGTSVNLIKILDEALYIANTKGDILRDEERNIKELNNIGTMETYDIEKYRGKLLVSNLTGVKELGSSKRKIDILSMKGPVFYKMRSVSEDTLIGQTRQTIMYAVKDAIKKILFFKKRIMTFELDKRVLWLGTDDGIYTMPIGFDQESKTHNGIIVFDTIKLNQSEYLKESRNTNIVKIVKDKKEGLWFCSKGDGLFYLIDEQLKSYNAENGLPDNVVNDLFFMENGGVLLATNSGLYYSKVIPLGNRFDDWRKIHKGAVSCCVSRSGKIYIGTSDGLVILNEDDLDTENEIVFLNLAGILIDSKEVNPATFTGLTSNQRNLEFNFDLINFTKDKPLIKYELKGMLTDVGYIENSNLRLGRLPPGNYSLTVYPDNPLGKKSALNFLFIVEPAFWQTTTFFVFSFIVIVLIAAITLWLIIRSRKKKQAEKLKNEKLLIEYKLIALKAQINPHFMSNCLSAIQDLIMSGDSEKATFYVAQFGLLVRQILNFSSKQLISLGEELDLLSIYMQLEQLRFEYKFVFKIHIQQDISTKNTYVPPLIFNPIVENAIWHGLLPLKDIKRGEIHIFATKREDQLMLSIQDNGVGRDVNKMAMSNQKGRSYGVDITSQRLKNINYLYKRTNARIVFSDLFDDKKKPLGTQVTIYLPSDLIPDTNEQN